MPQQSEFLPTADYGAFLASLKERIRNAQVKAALAVNKEMVLLYWQIGQDILERQRNEGWGSKVIQRLASDLKAAFPGMTGLSRTNLLYMRAFAEAWPDASIVQAPLGQITWYHNLALLDKLKSPEQRLWYAQQTIENGWSRNILVLQIENKLFDRQGKSLTNFQGNLPNPDSDLAQNLLKSEYNLEFLGITQEAHELELEQALVTHMRDFLLELGMGFAFVGNQHRLEIDGDEYFIDLLFYHLKLRRYIVIELKAKPFRPEYMGQLNFYVNVVNDTLRDEDDKETLGMVLCPSKKDTAARYALSGISNPLGISTYKVRDTLPKEFAAQLPSAEQLQQEIDFALATLQTKDATETEET